MAVDIATDPAAFGAVLAARRQHIRDTAECRTCRTTLKACDNDARRTHPDRPDSPEARCCTLGCRHQENRVALNALIDEIAAGTVRTVDEVDPPPVLGPRRVSMTWLLDQDVWWFSPSDGFTRIAQMDKPRRWNLARWLERRAPALEMRDQVRGIWAEAPDDVWASLENRTPQEFIEETPLHRTLTRGLPKPNCRKGQRMAERAAHWHTCPMRLAHPGAADRCMCIREHGNGAMGRIVGATNDPASAQAVTA